ncbi:MAG: BMP family ABC transporter substrate-binding protein [Lachnospiraceae bacterium]|nr:BMP family ABC transporter substrate-binding protein [Lachnospiraceae bacterium]
MKKKINILFMIVTLMLLVSACGTQTAPAVEPDNMQPADQTSDEIDDPEQDTVEDNTENSRDDRKSGVRIALVTDVSSVMDSGFNQAALQGIQTYADGAGVFYSTYSTDTDTSDSYKNTVLTAIQDNAELIVCVGTHFEQAVGELQNDYSDTYFLLLDGVPRDASGDFVDIASNVHCIAYREEEAGYLVGYMSVKEGYRKFGFIGGEPLPAVKGYGYGFLQGIDEAAVSIEDSDEIQVEYWYADTFSANKQIEEVSTEWYQSGTEIIFACGGSLYESVLSAAEECNGVLIGVDADQSGISGRFLTSATKGIDSSVIVALDDFFASGKKWPEELAGNVVSYGAKEKCISLPVQGNAWRFQTATINEYLQTLARLRSGDIQIPIDADTPPQVTVTVIYHDQQEESDS